MGLPLAVPSKHLAFAIAAEWDAQKKFLQPTQMPLMTLTCTALDQAAMHPNVYREQSLSYLPTDTVRILTLNERASIRSGWHSHTTFIFFVFSLFYPTFCRLAFGPTPQKIAFSIAAKNKPGVICTNLWENAFTMLLSLPKGRSKVCSWHENAPINRKSVYPTLPPSTKKPKNGRTLWMLGIWSPCIPFVCKPRVSW